MADVGERIDSLVNATGAVLCYQNMGTGAKSCLGCLCCNDSDNGANVFATARKFALANTRSVCPRHVRTVNGRVNSSFRLESLRYRQRE